MRRYLAAFGPATVTDVADVVRVAGAEAGAGGDAARSCTCTGTSGSGRCSICRTRRGLMKTSPRRCAFLPEFDNLLLSHADRTRVLADEHRKFVLMTGNLRVKATFLVDGFVAGTWQIVRKKQAATLELTPFAPLLPSTASELAAEGEALLHFHEADAATFAVTFATPGTAS